ncbi:MAG: 2-oxoglutarate dehydrogenase E1 component, partial [Gammaproteobacteria bacterium]
MSDSLKQKYQTTPLFGGNAPFLEDLYEQYLQDPDSVEEHWRSYFRGFETARPGQRDVPHGPIISELERRAREHRMAAQAGGEMSAMAAEKQAAVIRLIEAFRGRGHQAADIDPLGLQPRPEIPDLEPGFHGLSESDMDTEFSTPSMVGPDRLTLRQILDTLRETYCGRIGFEYMHVTDTDERRWIRERVEGERGRVELSDGERLNLLKELNGAEGLEKYLHTRYVGQKRFSLEGGESLIPMLEDIIQQGGRNGVREIVVGMAHRGRLNVLVNVLGKSPRELFSEFEGVYDAKVTDRSGDVKYHLGFSSDIKTAGGNVHLALAFNPSHLEIVNP